MSETRYKAILCDPPWKFRTFSGGDRDGTPRRTKTDHYQTEHTEDLMEIPVSDWADKNCALFMWVVGSHLKQAFELAEAWGFKYVTDAFVWVKTGKNDPNVRPISMGYWSRKQTETCLLFTRGKPKRLDAGVRQLIETDDHVIYAPKREHSRKPDDQYERIERLVDGPYLEMFARQSRDGWDAWGNETTKFDSPFAVSGQTDDFDSLFS
jgi:N6-adenosine-specific RNA methylase IME4